MREEYFHGNRSLSPFKSLKPFYCDMPESYTIDVVDESHVAPPPGSVSTTTIPLTFFDMAFLVARTCQRIFFYEFPCSTPHFTRTIFPNLKHSLSLTLRHFFPFAASLTCPPPPNHPYLLYKEGDSIPVTVAESDADFNHFIGNQARDSDVFQSLVPMMPWTSVSSDKTNVMPIMAIQITVFPNMGISIGITFNHMAADGRSFNHFMKSWAFIHRSGEEEYLTSSSLSLPYHNKGLIKDPDGLASVFLNEGWSCLSTRNSPGVGSSTTPSPAVPQDKYVYLTLVLNRVQIEKLKQFVIIQSREEPLIRGLSTYVVACAFAWVNLMKLQESECEDTVDRLDEEDMLYHFLGLADCRERFGLSIPAAYFGNCVAFFFASAKRSEMMAKNGIVVAAKAIGRAISKLEKERLIESEKWVSDMLEKTKVWERLVVISGSPKLRVYDTDFGWGKPKKSELGHLGYGIFSLNECRDEEGGTEIGLVIGRDKLDLFNAIVE